METKRLVWLALVLSGVGCDSPPNPMAIGERHSIDHITVIDAATGQCVALGINPGRSQRLNVTPLRPEACAFHSWEGR